MEQLNPPLLARPLDKVLRLQQTNSSSSSRPLDYLEQSLRQHSVSRPLLLRLNLAALELSANPVEVKLVYFSLSLINIHLISGFGNSAKPSAFGGGQTNTPAPAFGGQSSTPQQAGGVFSFGGGGASNATSPAAPNNAGFNFGAAAASPPSFNFGGPGGGGGGAAAAGPANMFGQSSGASNQPSAFSTGAPPQFGAGAGAPAAAGGGGGAGGSMFSIGAGGNQSRAAPSQRRIATARRTRK